MATVNGVTAERMQQILNASIESAAIQGSTLIFTRHDGSSFAAGDFNAFIASEVQAEVDAIVPPAVAGGLTAKGNISGAVTFPGLLPKDMVNRLFTATLTGAITIDSAAFPAPAVPATQFAMVLHQDLVGNRSLTLTGIKKSQGALTLSTGPNSIDIVSFLYDGSVWYAGLMGVSFI
jgi:hypothetical protein